MATQRVNQGSDLWGHQW